MRAFVIRMSDVARCSIRSLSVAHYNDDGTCLCPKEEPMPDKPKIEAVYPFIILNDRDMFCGEFEDRDQANARARELNADPDAPGTYRVVKNATR